MTVDIDDTGGVPVARIKGEVDLKTSPRVRKALLDVLKKRDTLIVDLSNVDYIDSSGVASLVEAYQTARKAGGQVSLAAVSQPALRVLQLARLDQVLPIRDSIESASAEIAE